MFRTRGFDFSAFPRPIRLLLLLGIAGFAGGLLAALALYSGSPSCRIEGRLIWPRVVRTAPDGTVQTLVAPPACKLLVCGPSPAALVATVGECLYAAEEHWAQPRRSLTDKAPARRVSDRDGA
jgi:hypothetical protein